MGRRATVFVLFICSKPRHQDGRASMSTVRSISSWSGHAVSPTVATSGTSKLAIPSLARSSKFGSPHCSFHPSWRMVSTFNTSTGAPELRAGNKVAILRLPSLDGYATQTVLHYFNHLYFFDNEAMRAGFMNSIPILSEETKNLLTVTLDDFFQTAWAKELAGGERDMVLFLTKTIYGCKGVAVLEAYSVWKINVHWHRWYQARCSESTHVGQNKR